MKVSVRYPRRCGRQRRLIAAIAVLITRKLETHTGNAEETVLPPQDQATHARNSRRAPRLALLATCPPYICSGKAGRSRRRLSLSPTTSGGDAGPP
ncbi:hypothetical protein EVAR_101364_1 [Eumeta japonica]|uniref:Uncharacterized protein n=1 Tax=Eumeta variegata TaxID=151549 RepID=A0A4C1SLT9_EUMVA|nr:hypothetical protein EVAR_101364_1 [Eumeta japonica]